MKHVAIDMSPTCGRPPVLSHPNFSLDIHQAQVSNPSRIRANKRNKSAAAYLTDRVGDGEEEDEKNPDHRRRLGPHAEAVARADGLRHDLREQRQSKALNSSIMREQKGGKELRAKGMGESPRQTQG